MLVDRQLQRHYRMAGYLEGLCKSHFPDEYESIVIARHFLWVHELSHAALRCLILIKLLKIQINQDVHLLSGADNFLCIYLIALRAIITSEINNRIRRKI